MKKRYITPLCTTVSLRPPQLLTASENEYSDNQGYVHFDSNEVDAGDGD